MTSSHLKPSARGTHPLLKQPATSSTPTNILVLNGRPWDNDRNSLSSSSPTPFCDHQGNSGKLWYPAHPRSLCQMKLKWMQARQWWNVRSILNSMVSVCMQFQLGNAMPPIPAGCGTPRPQRPGMRVRPQLRYAWECYCHQCLIVSNELWIVWVANAQPTKPKASSGWPMNRTAHIYCVVLICLSFLEKNDKHRERERDTHAHRHIPPKGWDPQGWDPQGWGPQGWGPQGGDHHFGFKLASNLHKGVAIHL